MTRKVALNCNEGNSLWRGEALCCFFVTHHSPLLRSFIPFFTDSSNLIVGVITGKTQAACRPGTTVAFKDLFKPFPVRHQEFIRGIKKDFAKLQDVIQAYAIIQADKKFVVFHQDKKGFVLFFPVPVIYRRKDEAEDFTYARKYGHADEYSFHIWCAFFTEYGSHPWGQP